MDHSPNTPKFPLTSPLKARLLARSRTALAFLGLVLLALTVTHPANAAACGGLGARDSAVKYPIPQDDGTMGPASIVGLWHVAYTANGASFGVSFKEWHSDGTEFEAGTRYLAKITESIIEQRSSSGIGRVPMPLF
jgi:hypothetical protein